MRYCFLIALYVVALVNSVLAQVPTILNSPQSLTEDTEVRDVDGVYLQTGFKYNANVGAISSPGISPFNLKINNSAYPPFVSSEYISTSAVSCSFSHPGGDALLGETSGNFAVSSSGAATYNIPIYVAPGTAGVQPALSINYSSDVKDGVLGIGWRLAATSAIIRTPRTPLPDGKFEEVKLLSNDVYSLDGNKLLLKSGLQGDPNSVYQSEGENFSKITAYSSQGNGPMYFIVVDKNGNQIEYGNSIDSRLIGIGGNSSVFTWFVNKITDQFGNYILYKYKTLTGEIVLDEIAYSGNASAGLLPYNSIKFDYIDKAEKNSFYVGGTEFRTTKLLKSITCNAEGQLVRKYNFDYVFDYNTLLKKVTEVTATGQELPPTIFCWGDPNFRTQYVSDGSINLFTTLSELTGLKKIITADLDGNGFSDVLCVYDSKYNFKINQYDYNNLTAPTLNFVNNNLPSSLINATTTILATSVVDTDYDGSQEVFVMFNKINDPQSYYIQKLYFNGTAMQTTYGPFSLSNAMNLGANPQPFFYDQNDYTGDGKIDELIADPEKIIINSIQGNLNYPYTGTKPIVRVMDYNGDGIMDVVILDDKITSVDVNVYKYDVGSSTLVPLVSTSIAYPTNFNGRLLNKIGMGDYNGDGKVDLCYLNLLNTELNILYSTGTGFSAAKKVNVFTSLPTISSTNDYLISCPDLNTDGKSDIIITNTTDQVNGSTDNYFSYYSTGDAFFKGGSAKGKWTYFEQWVLKYPPKVVYQNGVPNHHYYSSAAGYYPSWVKENVAVFNHNFDVNGDGIYDAISIKDLANQRIIFNSITSTRGNYLYQITTGMGKVIDITYANTATLFSANYKQVYGNASSVIYNHPLVKLKPNKFVVELVNFKATSVPTFLGTPEINNYMRYAYFDAVYHKEGRGFLGFEKTIAYETFTDLGNETTNDFSNSVYIPLVTQNRTGKIKINASGTTPSYSKYSLDPNLITSKVNTNYLLTAPPSNLGFFVAPQTVASKNYINGTGSQTTYGYDLFKAGNVINVQRDFLWNTGDQPERSETTVINWALAGPTGNKTYKPSSVTSSQTQKGASGPYSRTTNYTYHNTTGHLTQISNDPSFSGQNQNLITDFPDADYNAFGQATRVNISAGNVTPGPRTAQVQYDNKGRFVTKTTNALNHTNEFVYEPAYGNVIQSKDASGLVTTYAYDALGRLIQQNNPSGTIDKIKYAFNNALFQPSPKNGVYYISTLPEGAAPVTKYFDFYGRLLRTETLGLNNTVTYADNDYEEHGFLVKSTEPYYSGQTEYLYSTYTYETTFHRLTDENVYKTTQVGSPLYTNGYQYNSLATDAVYKNGKLTMSSRGAQSVIKQMNVAGQTTTVQSTTGGLTQNSVYTYTNNGQVAQIDLSYGAGNFVPSVTHKMGYNQLGQQDVLIDPSAGTINYAYNTLGELTQQSDALGTYDFAYDIIGRLVTKTGSNQGTTTYQYVSSGNGLGQLQKITGPNALTDLVYDNLNRATEYKETVIAGNKEFKTNYDYDKYNRVTQTTYPSGYITKNTYDALGYLTLIKNNANQALWQLNDVNAINQIKQYTFGNTIQTNNIYDPLHQLNQSDFGNLHRQVYNFNGNASLGQLSANDGNMYQRSFIKTPGIASPPTRFEEFSYDFNRLKKTQVQDVYNSNNALYTNNINFNPNGNITGKDDAGTYNYALPAKPFILTSIGNPQNNISLNTLNVTYTDFRKVKQINEAVTNKQMDFTYGNDEQRIKVDYKINGVNQYTRYYAQNYEREETTSGYKEWTYIAAPSGLAAVLYNNNGAQNLYYVNSDHLGSPVQLTDASQNVVEEYSFDAWGRRRNPADWTDYNVNTSGLILKRGFTFHEHIDEFNLINMNGRVYDPVLGRFIQPDNIVQDPDNISTFNRYSYVMNNPLKYIDPTGWGGQGPGSGGTGGVYGPLPEYGPSGTPPPYPYGTTLTEINNGFTFHGYFFTEGLMSNGGWTAFVSSNSPGYYMGGYSANPNNSANTNSPNAFYSLPTSGSYGVESANGPNSGGPRGGGNGGGGSQIATNENQLQSSNPYYKSEFQGYNQSQVDLITGSANGFTTVFGVSAQYSNFAKIASRVGVIGNVVSGAGYLHAVVTNQAKPSHHLDAAVTAIVIALSINPLTAPVGVVTGIIYGGARLIGGEAFDNWFNSKFDSPKSKQLIPIKK